MNYQRVLAIVLLIIGSLLLACASGFTVYAIGSNQQNHTTITFAPAATTIPTPDDAAKQFIAGFSQALASNDMTTVASETDQHNFIFFQHITNALGVDWTGFYEDMQAGTLTLSIQTPILFTCQNYSNSYASFSVMGTFTIIPNEVVTASGSGYAVFTFEQPEQGASWYWIELTLEGHQC